MSSAAQVYLGIDIGAESGRVMAGLWDGKAMRLEEVHRFPNGAVELAGTLRWDVLRLWNEVQSGLAAAGQRFGEAVVSVGVDTWALDYVLLSKSNELLGLPYTYRDPRTLGLIDTACATVPRAEIFAATGLQFMEINTLYQLLALQRDHPELLAAADCFLMIPDFLHWCLTGTRSVEFTNATTTQFCDPITRKWAFGLLDRLGLPTPMLPADHRAGNKAGRAPHECRRAHGLAHGGSHRARHARHRIRRGRRAHGAHRSRGLGLHQFRHLVAFGCGSDVARS